MKLDPKMTFRDVLLIGTILVAVSAAWFTLEDQAADAGEAAARAEKLSAQNTEQISKLIGVVNKLTTDIRVESETMKIKFGHLKERVGGFERRIDRGSD